MADPRPLPPELTIYAAADCREAWLDWLEAPAGDGSASQPLELLELDGSTVTEVDVAGVQLLVSLANALEQRGRRLALSAASPALGDACERLGVGFLLAGARVETA